MSLCFTTLSVEVPQASSPANDAIPKVTTTTGGGDSRASKGAIIKAAIDKLKDSKKSDDESRPSDGEARDEPVLRSKSEHRAEASGDRSKKRDRERERERERDRDRRVQDRERGRDSDREREREESERDRDKAKDRGRRSKDGGKDSGHSEKSRYHSSRDGDYHSSSYSSR